jgi:hypothetical protein
MELRQAAKESLAELHTASRKAEDLQIKLDAAIHASQQPSPAPQLSTDTCLHGGAGFSGAGGVASDSGVGGQKCTQDEIQAL